MSPIISSENFVEQKCLLVLPTVEPRFLGRAALSSLCLLLARLELDKSMLLMVQIFWDVAPCRLVSTCRRFEASFSVWTPGH